MEFYKAVEFQTISMTDEIENGCANFVHMHEKGDRLACLVTINLGLSYSRHSGSSTVTDSFYTEMSCELVMKCLFPEGRETQLRYIFQVAYRYIGKPHDALIIFTI